MPDADSYSDQMTATLALSGANIESFVEAFTSDHVSDTKSSHCRSLLIDTMQLVEPRCSIGLPVPNHVLDTKLYRKVSENGMIRVSPVVVHFAGFEPCRRFVRKLKLQNMSTDMQHMHIIPPQTQYFSIKYTKKERLAPGFSLNCTIEFCPDEWRYYYDCVRIHCKDEKNLIIPIHGYPVMKASEFPHLIDFPAVPLGETKTKVIPLRCHAPIDFEFQLTILQCSPAFEVEPMAGTVPGNGEVEIRVSFHPTSFSSSTMKMQLEISQYLALPLICTVTGCCFPGMKRNILLAKNRSSTFDESLSPQRTLDPTMISPLERAHCRKLKMKTPRAAFESEKQIVECNGLRIPANLDNPHAVGVVLNQKAGKLRMKDLRSDLLGAQGQGQSAALTRQMKEAMFDMATRKDVYEERQNQLRWQVKLGRDPVSAECCVSVLAKRKEAEEVYKVHVGELDENDECTRTVAKLSWRRTRRFASWVAPPVAAFDTIVNDLWLSRQAAIQRFQQAAGKVIIRLRVKPRLAALRHFLENPSMLETEEEPTCATEVKQLDDEHEALCLNIARISSVTFPVFSTEGVRSEKPGVLTLKPVEVKLNEKVPYLPLKVPQQYKLLGYRPFSIQDASSNYISTNLARPLRTGAEDELVDLGLPEMSRGGSAIQISASGIQSEVAPLVAPKAMLHPIKYSALHIFNPVPGIMTFQNHLPYSETDPDFHLCTLPRFFSANVTNPHMATQKQYLTRQEIIKGVMTWKKFPSPSIASLTGTPTLTNVWVPRWSDPFSQELLPYNVPDLLDSVAEDDKLIISTQSGVSVDNEIQLTPQMVSAEFAAIDVNCKTDEEIKDIKSEILAMSAPETDRLPPNNLPFDENGPITRDQREANLNQLLKKKLGLLGQRIHSRTNHIESLKKKKTAPNN